MCGAARPGEYLLVGTPQTLLIVDDNEAVRNALGAYMHRVAGWPTVLTAEDADTGLELASACAPDAIVLDNLMPGQNGIDVLPELRRACPQARIVMHTTDDNELMRHRARALGADALVVKGRPLEELADLIAV
jgi:two-component system chemotaxis response regulator CheB